VIEQKKWVDYGGPITEDVPVGFTTSSIVSAKKQAPVIEGGSRSAITGTNS